MIVVGLTGNLASGKSEASKILKKLGAMIVDADAVAQKLTAQGTPIHRAIRKIFGDGFFTRSGQLNRRKLAWHVFSHPNDLKKLNTLIHPGVIVELYRVLEKERRKKGVLVLSVPLLFESRMEKLADWTVLIASDTPTMLARASARGVPPLLAKKILASQWPMARKEKAVDFVIDNNGTLAQLAVKLKKVYHEIKNLT